MSALLEVRDLRKYFPVRRGLLQRVIGQVKALDGVSLELAAGECLALVGESGSGKTTFGRCVLRLEEPTAGVVRFRGEDLLALSPAELRRRRKHFQVVFQDPYGSLNPRMRVSKILSEPLEVHETVPEAQRAKRIEELLTLVGLTAEAGSRFPHEFSGGQRQRIGIARALAPEPTLLIADEPVSALDVSVRAQIINLLVDLQRRFGLTMIFIAHDLAVVEQTADRVGVMYLGKIVELGATESLFSSPMHPYTVSLLSAVPVADPARRRQRILLTGEPPSPASPPTGCAFHPRCPIAKERCREEEPKLTESTDTRQVSCHYPGELQPDGAGLSVGGTF